MNIEETYIVSQRSAFYVVATVALSILLIPFLAMEFTDEVSWDIADFAVMGFLLFSMGCLFVIISRRTQRRHRILIVVMLAIVFFYIWAELAVGIFTTLGS